MAAAEMELASWHVTVRLIFAAAGLLAAPASLLAAVDDNQYDTPLYPNARPLYPDAPTDPLSSEIPGLEFATPKPDVPTPAPEVSFGTLLQRLDNPVANGVPPRQPGFSTGDTTKSYSTNPGSTTLDTTHSFSIGVKPPGF